MKKIFCIVRSVFVASVFLTGVSSCQLFENDVADFMEKYTETAAIERHDFNVGTYEDSNSRLCIASEADTQISLYMRNPKKFNLVPSVTFPELGSQFSTSYVDINQTDSSRIELSLPQEFLIPVDEGQNITAEVRLYEPMSGRDFDRYKISLSCNTIPPLILNSTIFNVGNSTFGVAFDMPNPSEVAIRHKDISEIEINGKTFPVTITTEEDPEIEGAYVAKYTIEDSHFVRSLPSSYSFLGEKTFEHKDSTSFYYVTDDPFVNGEKEYTLILRDRAGLKSEAKASTTISRLAKPLILDQSGNEIEEGVVANIPYDEETERGTVTVIPPTRDHHGDSVSGTTVFYKVYDASGSGKLYTSGSTTTAKTINLPQNTYRIEAYAVLTNYENSPTTSVKCRLMNNVIYVAPVTDPITDVTYDGSAIHPFTSILEVINDINANRIGENRKSKYTILIKGDFTAPTYSVSSPDAPLDNGSVTVGLIETDELVFEQWPGEEAAMLNTISVSPSADSSTTLKKVKIGKITLGSSHHAVKLDLNGDITYEIDGTVINNPNKYSNSTGINVSSGADVTIKSCTISDYEEGIKVSDSTLVINNISIARCDYGIKNNGNASVINLYGGKITENNCGIDAGVGTINVKGKPEVYGNVGYDENGLLETCNIKLGEDKKINIVGPLTSGCKLGIYVDENNKPEVFGDKYVFTEGYHSNNPSIAPSTYFISDSDLSIVLSGNEAGVALTGGNGNMGGGAFDYHFDFVVSDALDSTNEPVGFYPGEKKEIYIKPVITNGSEVVAYTSIKNDVDWTAFVYNGGTVAETLTPVATDSGIKLTLSGSIEAIGSYNIKVAALYSSIYHDLSVPLTCSKTVEFAASYISKLTASATVEVTGVLDADGLGKIKTALTTLYSNSPNVRVKINARETSCEHPSDLNTGGYFRGCDALSEMILPDWMANIPPSLFAGCSNLTSVTIAGTVSVIYEAAFAGCTSLTTVNYNGSKADWGKIERVIGWHEGVPSATEVTCEDGEKCSLDYDG